EDPELFTRYLTLFGCEKTRSKQLDTICADYAAWMKTYDRSNTLPLFDRFTRIGYQQFLRSKYGIVQRLSDAWGEGRFTSFDHVNMDVESNYPYHLSQWLPPVDQKRYADYADFLTHLSATMKCPITAQYLWVKYLESTVSDFKALQQKAGLTAESVYQIPLSAGASPNPVLAPLVSDFF